VIIRLNVVSPAVRPKPFSISPAPIPPITELAMPLAAALESRRLLIARSEDTQHRMDDRDASRHDI
jgi:hypothetical protein